MKIILAKSAGFCMGVARAIEIVLEQMRSGAPPVATHGPLIHNPQVIEMLEKKGVNILDDNLPGKDTKKGTVVIRAHGITPAEEKRLHDDGYQVIDATCPHVIRIQKLIERNIGEDRDILIVGDHGHAEVNGLLGHAGERGHVVATEKNIDDLPSLDRVCVVSQTTQTRDRFDRLLARIRERWPDAEVHRTICDATHLRQKETVEIAREADVMLVVGGKNSANTVRLAQLAAETGTPTYHIETADEIDVESLEKARTAGLTAGASTPDWIIEEVRKRLEDFQSKG